MKIKRVDKTIPLPAYKTPKAAGMDLYTREAVTIKPSELVYIPLNVAIKMPEGYFGLITERSSTHKLGIRMANSVGILDGDYCGNEDEIKFAATNITDKEVTIGKGTRIAQLIIIPYLKSDIIEIDEMDDVSRGGFGTTGHN